MRGENRGIESRETIKECLLIGLVTYGSIEDHSSSGIVELGVSEIANQLKDAGFDADRVNHVIKPFLREKFNEANPEELLKELVDEEKIGIRYYFYRK